MGQNLTGQLISATYESLVQISGSIITDGTGSDITSLDITASNAISALSANSASVATSASFADTSTSSSYALTASFALNAGAIDSGSFMITGSVSSNTLTFEKGDGSTFSVTVDTGSAVTVDTGSLLVTASISDATTTFTKGDGSTFALTVNNVQNAFTASTAVSASQATNANTATSASFATTASFALNVTPINTGSFVTTGSATGNVLTFTKADASTFALTVDTGSAGAAFPFTGSAQITGSLAVTGSIEVLGTPALHYRLVSKNGINAGDGGSIAQNTFNAGDGSIVGGQSNVIGAGGARGTIIGGNANQITGGQDGVVVGGRSTITSGEVGLIAGGFTNTLTAGYAALVGCFNINTSTLNASSQGTVLVGAKGGYLFSNTQTDRPAIVFGGFANSGSAIGDGNTQLGGVNNFITGSITGSSMIGGELNTLGHSRSVIIGGTGITSSADNTVYVPNLYVSGSLTGPNLNIPSTGSLLVTGSVAGNVLTFTKGDASTFSLTVDTGSLKKQAVDFEKKLGRVLKEAGKFANNTGIKPPSQEAIYG